MSSEIEPWTPTEQGNLALIQAVKKHPCLYNNTLPEYSHKDVISAAWQEIADQFGCSVPACKKQWMGLRTAYTKDVRKRKAGKKKPHRLAEYLDFIAPFRIINQQESINKALQHDAADSLHKKINQTLPPCTTSLDYNIDSDTEMDVTEFIIVENTTESSNVQNYVLEENTDPPQVDKTLDNDKLENLVTAKSDSSLVGTRNTSVSRNHMFNTENSRMQYILSLKPELDGMTENQFRVFKRKLLSLIDEVKMGPH